MMRSDNLLLRSPIVVVAMVLMVLVHNGSDAVRIHNDEESPIILPCDNFDVLSAHDCSVVCASLYPLFEDGSCSCEASTGLSTLLCTKPEIIPTALDNYRQLYYAAFDPICEKTIIRTISEEFLNCTLENDIASLFPNASLITETPTGEEVDATCSNECLQRTATVAANLISAGCGTWNMSFDSAPFEFINIYRESLPYLRFHCASSPSGFCGRVFGVVDAIDNNATSQLCSTLEDHEGCFGSYINLVENNPDILPAHLANIHPQDVIYRVVSECDVLGVDVSQTALSQQAVASYTSSAGVTKGSLLATLFVAIITTLLIFK